jgi:thiamine pyrophosphokinase
VRAIIFVNGMVEDYDSLRRWLQPEDYLICADGGTRHCTALEITPHAIVGDMDSADPAVLAAFAKDGADVERHPPAKDRTDLELALERALRDGASEVLLLGALGGRLDQTLANLHIIAQRHWPVPIRIAEGAQVAQILTGGDRLTLNAPVNSTVSVIPFSPQVTGITYTGLRYPLYDATLRFGSTRGISNEIAARPATIEIGEGVLLVVVEVEEVEE